MTRFVAGSLLVSTLLVSTLLVSTFDHQRVGGGHLGVDGSHPNCASRSAYWLLW